MNVLFVCNQNLNRSRTAEDLFKGVCNTRSAGLYNTTPVAERDLLWADVVVVMEDAQRRELSKRFPAAYLKKRIVSLDIADIYRYGQKELVDLLKRKESSIGIA